VKRVAASEALILTVARAIVGFEQQGAAEWILARENKPPANFGPTSLGLLRETLSKGIVFELIRRGGGAPQSYMSTSTGVAHGRLWERHQPLRLDFSEYVVHLLRWLVATPMRETRLPAMKQRPKTLADELFAFLAFDLCARTFNAIAPSQDASFSTNPLIQLGFVDYFYLNSDQKFPDDFTRLCDDRGAVFLEALQPTLTKRWIEILKKSSTIESNEELLRFGSHTRRVLDVFLAALAARGRPDLARFFLDASRAILAAFSEPNRFVARLVKRGPFAEQVVARREAFAFVAALQRLRTFADEARAVRFFDETYETSQLYLRLWETLGDAQVERAARMAQDIALD
jgi:hypothetical protein